MLLVQGCSHGRSLRLLRCENRLGMENLAIATVNDIPELAELLTILFAQEADFQPDREKQMRGLRLIVEDPRQGRVFVVRRDGKIVGMVSLLFTVSTAEGEPACWLEDLVVRPEHRGTRPWERVCFSTPSHMPRRTDSPASRSLPTARTRMPFGSTNGTGSAHLK